MEMINELYGLVMMGGKSTRMGLDKTQISYHGKSQDEFIYTLLNTILSTTYVSVSENKKVSFTDKTIPDAFDIKGPMNGLLSAFNAFPEKTWLVVAIDLPFITEQTIRRLIDRRDGNGLATAVADPKSRLPEPLVAIWEPRGLDLLEKQYMSGQNVYPRKFLIDHSVKLVAPIDDQELFNVNSQTDYEQAQRMLRKTF